MYIDDYNNVIDIEDIVKQALKDINTYDRKVFNKFKKVEIIIPCLYHRNNPEAVRGTEVSDRFNNIRKLDFPYTTTYKFPHHRPVEVIIYDDFYNVDKTVEGFDSLKELEKYIRVELHTPGYKLWFVGYVRGIGGQK